MTADELVYRRAFKAPRELVWRCLTEPAELAQFWGPRGMTTPLDGIVVELRVGGRFETLMVGGHGSHHMIATFTEVVPPERLAWLEPASGVHTTSTLGDLPDGGTEVVIHQRHVPEAMRAPEARAGIVTCATTCRSCHPWHSDGASQVPSGAESSRSARPAYVGATQDCGSVTVGLLESAGRGAPRACRGR